MPIPSFNYTQKAARQVVKAPEYDCGTHPQTVFARVPDHLRDRIEGDYDYVCRDCLADLERAHQQERQEERRQQAELEAAARAELRAAEEAALQAQGRLSEVYAQAVGWADDHARRVAAAEGTVEVVADRLHRAQRVVEAKQAMLMAARQELARAKAVVARTERDLGAAQVEADTVRGEEPFALGTLQATLDACERAWDAAPPRRKRKKMDRGLVKRVRKILQRMTGS